MIDLRVVKVVRVVHHNRVVKVLEYVHDASTIPIVSHTATIVYVTCCVFEHFVRYFRILHQEHFQLTQANSQIAIGELVRYVEAQRTEFSSLKCDTVKQ